MIKVLIVEDSAVNQEFLTYVLNSDPAIQVIGSVNDGDEALEAVRRERPDVITMDIHMPKMNGFDATRRIMETRPTPIVIVSGSTTREEIATTFHALEAGALAVVMRPEGIGHPNHETMKKELIQHVKLMSEVKVVKRWAKLRQEGKSAEPGRETNIFREIPRDLKIIAIGASTGGPLVLQAILSGLPKDFPISILIVQHMAAGFIAGFVQWLEQSSGFPVRLVSQGEIPLPGWAYVAPDGFQMKVEKNGQLILTKDDFENGLRPSVSYLFRSVANVYGPSAIGVLLTGMGKDGAEELRLLKERGGVTIVQDKASCVVYGMPAEAVKLEAVTAALAPDKIAAALRSLVNKPSQT